MAHQTLVQRVARVGNKHLGSVLSSPTLVRLLGREPVRVRYTGRRSGRAVELPAWAKVTATGVVIDVGAPSQKNWWRNFRTTQPLEIQLDGAWRPGTGIVHEPRTGRVQVRVTWTRRPEDAEHADHAALATAEPGARD